MTLYVSDNVFTANITISIDIDHPPMLSANTTAITILEGDFSSPIGMVADLRLTDVDRHEVIMMMNAQLQGVLDPEEEFITWYFNNQWIRSNNGWLNLTDTGTVDDFQVGTLMSSCLWASVLPIRMFQGTHARTGTHTHVRMHTHTATHRTNTHTQHTPTHTHMCARAQAHAHTHARTQAHTHTHTSHSSHPVLGHYFNNLL